MLSLFFTIVFFGCGTKTLIYPGPTKYLGRGSNSYVVRNKRKIEKAATRFQEEKERARLGRIVAQTASSFVGKTSLRVGDVRYRYDCSGFIEAVYSKSGINLHGSSRMLHDQAKSLGLLHSKETPLPGDIAFFDNSYDRNKNGRMDDKLTHVAIVERVDPGGQLTLIHLGSRGVVRTHMNLRKPSLHKSTDGKVLNSYLRVRSTKKDKGPRLTGELWVSFASLWQQTG